MILTEDEAKTKICPIQPSVVRAKSHGLVEERPLCSASGCMKWRWADNKSPAETAKWDPLQTGAVGFCGP